MKLSVWLGMLSVCVGLFFLSVQAKPQILTAERAVIGAGSVGAATGYASVLMAAMGRLSTVVKRLGKGKGKGKGKGGKGGKGGKNGKGGKGGKSLALGIGIDVEIEIDIDGNSNPSNGNNDNQNSGNNRNDEFMDPRKNHRKVKTYNQDGEEFGKFYQDRRDKDAWWTMATDENGKEYWQKYQKVDDDTLERKSVVDKNGNPVSVKGKASIKLGPITINYSKDLF